MTTPTLLFGASCLLIAAVALLAARRRDRTQAHLERLVSDLRDVSRAEIARLDAKIRELRQLLDRAETALELKPQNALRERVCALARAGKPPADVAAETGLDRGEVELLLGLRDLPARGRSA